VSRPAFRFTPSRTSHMAIELPVAHDKYKFVRHVFFGEALNDPFAGRRKSRGMPRLERVVGLSHRRSVRDSTRSFQQDAIRKLALKGTWAAQNDWGYWSWSEDGTLCLRVFGPDGDCADTGTWSINGEVMCYELTWWGEGYDVRKNCYTVHGLDGEHFETRYHGGALDTVFTTFTVIE
jgi:hypothetical protein